MGAGNRQSISSHVTVTKSTEAPHRQPQPPRISRQGEIFRCLGGPQYHSVLVGLGWKRMRAAFRDGLALSRLDVLFAMGWISGSSFFFFSLLMF